MIKSAIYNNRQLCTLMPQPKNQTPGSSDRINALFWGGEIPNSDREFSPFFYAEARIDFNDVRTGFRETVSLKKALELFSDQDLIWADDMIRDIDPDKIGVIAPDGISLQSLPNFVDEQFISRMESKLIQYLMRRFEAKVYRNSVLNIYSFSGELLSQFSSRCFELLDSPMRHELASLHEVYNRKLTQIKQKYLGYEDDSGEFETAKLDSRNRDAISRISERMAELFLRAEFSLRPVAGPFRNLQGAQELEERLLSLELESQQVIAKLWDSYAEKARAIDEYVLHPNLKDIHLVRSCILWMPKNCR
jgi:hypothetical protein